MKEWTYKGVWQASEKENYYIRVIHKVLAYSEQIAAERAFEWFMGNMEGHEEYSITFPSTKYELVMREKV